MRESNFAFPTQNKACVCITSQLYDRRALDTTSPLPLLNSLTHLTYLTSTSPRIREIMTMDGGLERLVRILHDFCLCPPPPENGALMYGLIPPSMHPPKPPPTLNPPTWDKQAAYRFSLAFQCVVNIGVRGSEPIRSRVVQAGTLEVVGCILEAWLANKGFAVGPSSSATGMPRETREQRQARREAQMAQRMREQAAELERQRNRLPLTPASVPHPQRGPRPPMLRLPGQFEDVRVFLIHAVPLPFSFPPSSPEQPNPNPTLSPPQQDEESTASTSTSMDVSPTRANDSSASAPASASASSSSNLHEALLLLSTPSSAAPSDTELSAAPTPVGSGTPTGSVVVPANVRDRSGTIIARPVWDPAPPGPSSTSTLSHRRDRERGRERESMRASPSPSPDSPAGYTDSSSRPETETEDDGEGEGDVDGDGDVDMDRSATLRARQPSYQHTHHGQQAGASSQSQAQAGGSHGHGHRMSISHTHPQAVLHTHTHAHPHPHPHPRRAVGIVSDAPPATDAHIIINEGTLEPPAHDFGGVGVGAGGVEDGIVSLEANDDFAMGAPPGAPGAIVGVGVGVGVGGEGRGGGGAESEGMEGEGTQGTQEEMRERGGERGRGRAPDETPRPGVVGLPPAILGGGAGGRAQAGPVPTQPQLQPAPAPAPMAATATLTATVTPTPSGATTATHTAGGGGAGAHNTTHTHRHRTSTHHHSHPHHHPHSHHHERERERHQEPQGPYRDEDVLLSLQLLAYLSKYPHVRQAFYKPRVTFHPASVDVVGGRWGAQGREGAREREREVVVPAGKGRAVGKERQGQGETGKDGGAAGGGGGAAGFLRSLGVGVARGPKEKEKELEKDATPTSGASASASASAGSSKPLRQTNVFSLVERFTFKPSSTEADLPHPPPKLPTEIQYWAGVVMRNACRKDDSRGGIRQCANMLCGRWENYPREFAKCRRCRKAKYCGKECQSTAWSEGHRFWCSAKDDEDATSAAEAALAAGAGMASAPAPAPGPSEGRRERRDRERERERAARERMAERERPAPPAAAHPGVIGEGLRGPGMNGAGAGAGPARAPPGGTQRVEAWTDPRQGPPPPRVHARAAQQFVLPSQPQTQSQQPGAPGSSRTRDADRESTTTTATSRVQAPQYMAYDAYAEPAGLAGRRRAETVSGASTVLSGGVPVGLGAPDGRMMYGPGGQGRLPPPRSFAVGPGTVANPLLQQQPSQYFGHGHAPQQFAAGNVGRGEAGPSRWRRQDAVMPTTGPPFRSPVEENDMVLG
ncbi:putative MYND finger [Lyophyllum shimeji]|uniref:MYND finger n=1 Tax=Lyophyllum shimeji TaxID=47721 RepID=A0A9P3PZW6_LYOSH|nr:putative MYND finger [Lyophyllum shimeji]